MNNDEMLRDLQKISEMITKRHDSPLRVVVKTANRGIPRAHMVDVSGIYAGFDWENGLLIVQTVDPVVVVHGLNEPVRLVAEQQLQALKAIHEKLGFKYIPKSRERDWCDGFVEGVRMHVTACSGEE